MKPALDVSAYLVAGPENTKGRPLASVVEQAVRAGFSCVQIRSKECSARELIDHVCDAAGVLARLGKSDTVALLVDDRVDVALAARMRGAKVDGVHVGQSDIPPELCRALLGDDAIVGLSARATEMLDYVKTADMSQVDYLGVGPLRETATKPDCGVDENGELITKSYADIAALAKASPVPIVVGGGVKRADLAAVRATGAAGFFVVSAVCGEPDPFVAARDLVHEWEHSCM